MVGDRGGHFVVDDLGPNLALRVQEDPGQMKKKLTIAIRDDELEFPFGYQTVSYGHHEGEHVKLGQHWVFIYVLDNGDVDLDWGYHEQDIPKGALRRPRER